MMRAGRRRRVSAASLAPTTEQDPQHQLGPSIIASVPDTPAGGTILGSLATLGTGADAAAMGGTPLSALAMGGGASAANGGEGMSVGVYGYAAEERALRAAGVSRSEAAFLDVRQGSTGCCPPAR